MSNQTYENQDPNQIYTIFLDAYKFLNDNLFDGTLSNNVLITINYKKKDAFGFYGHERFATLDEKDRLHEIGMNPTYFTEGEYRYVLSTLLHEMAHVWQFAYGTPAKASHNKEWAMKMIELGLTPYNTADPSKQWGRNCTHDIEEGGVFDKLMDEYLGDDDELPFKLPTKEEQETAAPRRKKHTCTCGKNVQAKPGDLYVCLNCVDVDIIREIEKLVDLMVEV